MSPPSATNPATSEESQLPTPQQLLFARAVILTFELWPAMRLAVNEEWGGPDSADKRDYLINYLCDEHGDAGPSNEPDLDDLAETLESYVIEEYECRLDDGSSDWVAGRIVGLHRAIFSGEAGKGEEAVQELEKAFSELKSKNTSATAGQGPEEVAPNHDGVDGQAIDEADVIISSAERLAASQGGILNVDELGAQAGQQQREKREKVEPVIDEDGFETVVSRKKR